MSATTDYRKSLDELIRLTRDHADTSVSGVSGQINTRLGHMDWERYEARKVLLQLTSQLSEALERFTALPDEDRASVNMRKAGLSRSIASMSNRLDASLNRRSANKDQRALTLSRTLRGSLTCDIIAASVKTIRNSTLLPDFEYNGQMQGQGFWDSAQLSESLRLLDRVITDVQPLQREGMESTMAGNIIASVASLIQGYSGSVQLIRAKDQQADTSEASANLTRLYDIQSALKQLNVQGDVDQAAFTSLSNASSS